MTIHFDTDKARQDVLDRPDAWAGNGEDAL